MLVVNEAVYHEVFLDKTDILATSLNIFKSSV